MLLRLLTPLLLINATASAHAYTLSLHDALPIYGENLPSLKNFQHRFQFQNTVIRDWNGQKLYDLADLSKSRGKRVVEPLDRKSTRLNSSHPSISYAVFCLKKKSPDPHSHPAYHH